ncbi:type II toxin-antitoxin system RelE/ParE family toxin [Luteolibacter sp. SL250]|uniref:type II toxin-antitoxin system RelE/ParE family toxin n=1 Tax=Luteolibacter sp. SL250 TaxID=2995170 RepID=UPI00226EE87A|nr:type II toxin-antitoxin system RelE/ParE family toxin [Luteolibacter sp. SL250]WAC20817.1 type II toxin-antitoxin system RelE/ParE family toxin [Luteolibacter sp. SL250]
MSVFVLSDEALSDLFDAWSFVANDHPIAADKLEQDILRACALLARHPGIGHRRADLYDDDSVRFHPVRTWYLVVYEWNTTPLSIVRILHGSRDVIRELGDG